MSLERLFLVRVTSGTLVVELQAIFFLSFCYQFTCSYVKSLFIFFSTRKLPVDCIQYCAKFYLVADFSIDLFSPLLLLLKVVFGFLTT